MSSTSTHTCVYRNCLKFDKFHKDVSFFKFPVKNRERAEEWKKNCGNTQIAHIDVEDLKNKLICEKHFLPKDILINNRRKLLTQTAVPVKFVETDPEEVSYTAGSEQVINGNSTSSDSLIIPSVSGNDVNIKATSSSWHQSILTYERNRLSSDSDAVAVGQDKIIDTSSINVDIDISDDTFQDGLSSTACFYLEPMKMPSPVSLSSEESHLSLSDNEIGSADEEIIVAKYPVNSNIHFEQDKELPLIESLKCDLNRLSNLCAKRKKIVNELNETKRRNEMDIQNLKQELDDLYKAFSEKKSQEIGNIKSSDLTKRPKRRRFLFKKAHSPAESLSLTLNVSSRRTCESIKRAGVLTIDVDGSGKNITFLKSSIR